MPYAILAQRAIEDKVEDADPDPTNELQDLMLIGTDLQITGNPTATVIDLSSLTGDDDPDPENEIQTLDKVGNTVTLSHEGGSFIDETEDDDSDPTNEIQDLELIGTNLQITGNSSPTVIDLSHLTGDDDPDPTNEIQDLELSGNTLSIVNGGGSPDVTLPTSLWEQGPGYIHRDGGDVMIRNSAERDVIGFGSFTADAEKGIMVVFGDEEERVISAADPGTGTGYSLTYGPNGRENCIMGVLNGFPNHGFVSVTGPGGLPSSLEPQAGMFVDPNGNGMLQINGAGVTVPGEIFIDPFFGSIVQANIKTFVMPHPKDASKEIVYTSLEGPEAAAYERGTAKLENGEAWIPFSEHFEIVINPETMTVNLTPNSANTLGLAVVEKTAKGIRVKELMNGTGNFEFDWEAKAVRKGYEDLPVIRNKKEPFRINPISRNSLNK